MAVTVFRCGRCGKRYANPRTHTCVTRMDRKRKPGRTTLAPQASRTCRTCGKPYANPFTHVCKARTDYRRRTAAQARAGRRAATAQDRARTRAAAQAKAAADRQRQRAAIREAVDRERAKRRGAVKAAVARERQRTSARTGQAKTAPKARPASGGTGHQRAADNHDYRECFYASQPDRGRARQDCERFPCRVYREGHEHGYADGYARGWAAGYAVGYSAGYAKGYPDGIRDCPLPHGTA